MTQPNAHARKRFLLSALRLKCRLGNIVSRMGNRYKTVYVWERIPFYRQMWETAAAEVSAQFIELAEGIWEIRLGSSRTYIHIHQVQLDDAVISSFSGNKPYCYDVLSRAHLPVPDHVVFGIDDPDEAVRFMKRKNGLIVVKPALDTGSGMGVTTHVRSVHECRSAIALASLYGAKIIAEDLKPGECYRLLVLNGKMIHAVRRRGVRVRGDGRSTLAQLIAGENRQRREGRTHDARPVIIWNRDLAATLLAQGLTGDFIPPCGRETLVQSYALPDDKHVEVRTVYNEVVTDLICRELRESVERAALLIHSKFAGVDVITLDPSVPLERNSGVINEINTNPGLHHHFTRSTRDTYDRADDIGPALRVLEQLLGIARSVDYVRNAAVGALPENGDSLMRIRQGGVHYEWLNPY